MTKNITVVDENDNILESTYPKRAKGLVKKGRAEWISDTAIRIHSAFCNMEGNKMANNIYEVFDNQVSKMQEQIKDDPSETSANVRIQILKTMENLRVQEQNEKVIDLVKEQLDKMQDLMAKEEPTDKNSSAREVTRQKMLDIMGLLIKNSNCNGKPPHHHHRKLEHNFELCGSEKTFKTLENKETML